MIVIMMTMMMLMMMIEIRLSYRRQLIIGRRAGERSDITGPCLDPGRYEWVVTRLTVRTEEQGYCGGRCQRKHFINHSVNETGGGVRSLCMQKVEGQCGPGSHNLRTSSAVQFMVGETCSPLAKQKRLVVIRWGEDSIPPPPHPAVLLIIRHGCRALDMHRSSPDHSNRHSFDGFIASGICLKCRWDRKGCPDDDTEGVRPSLQHL